MQQLEYELSCANAYGICKIRGSHGDDVHCNLLGFDAVWIYGLVPPEYGGNVSVGEFNVLLNCF
jgi:hypothetical protein